MEMKKQTAARAVAITTPTIRLCDFLKLAGVCRSGSEAKAAVAVGGVSVNGSITTVKGLQLRPGDVVTMGNKTLEVTANDGK